MAMTEYTRQQQQQQQQQHQQQQHQQQHLMQHHQQQLQQLQLQQQQFSLMQQAGLAEGGADGGGRWAQEVVPLPAAVAGLVIGAGRCHIRTIEDAVRRATGIDAVQLTVPRSPMGPGGSFIAGDTFVLCEAPATAGGERAVAVARDAVAGRIAHHVERLSRRASRFATSAADRWVAAVPLAGTDEAEPSAEESTQADELAQMVSELLPEEEAEEEPPAVTAEYHSEW